MSKITKEEYLKAKAIVEEYEQYLYEDNQSEADWSLEEDEYFDEGEDEECSQCGFLGGDHYPTCLYNRDHFETRDLL